MSGISVGFKACYEKLVPSRRPRSVSHRSVRIVFVMHSVHEPLLLVPFNCHKKRTPYERTPYDLAGLKTLYLLRKTYNLSVASETLWLYSLSLSHVCFFYKAVESSIFNPSRLSQFQRPKKFRDQLVFIISLSLKTKPHI